MRSAILTPALKGKDSSNKNDQLYLKNWRPISLLNIDYKIGAKALTNRLQNVLNPDQTCNVPGRSILDNLYLICDSYEYIFPQRGTSILGGRGAWTPPQVQRQHLGQGLAKFTK